MSRTQKYVGICIVALLAVVLFTRSHSRPITEKEAAFNTWYESVQQNFIASSTLDSVPAITLSLKLGSTTPSPWVVASKIAGSPSTPESRDRVARLLQLVKEGRIFGLPEEAARTDAVHLEIAGGPSTFKIDFAPDAVRENIQAQNLLKLFQIFATQPVPAPTTSLSGS